MGQSWCPFSWIVLTKTVLSVTKDMLAAGLDGNCCTSMAWWRHQMETFPRYWPFVRGIHRSPVNSPHKDQWSAWVNNCEAGNLRHHRAHHDVTAMETFSKMCSYCFKTRHWICDAFWIYIYMSTAKTISSFTYFRAMRSGVNFEIYTYIYIWIDITLIEKRRRCVITDNTMHITNVLWA